MASHFRCAQGHRWNADAGSEANGGTAALCPVCQGVGAPASSNGATPRPADAAADAETVALTAPAAEASAELPAVAGYEILEELGRGGMGVVYKARQLRLNRLVALKMVLGGAHAAAGDLVRFLAEAEAAAQLQHANIVQVHEVGSHGSLPFISLEYVDGGTLAQKLKGTPLPPRQAASPTATLGRAVQYAHQHGVVHRDLKPGNVLLTAEGTPKIADFGLAKRSAAGPGMTQTGAIIGTPSYMAPEQAACKKDIGPGADVYALGAILYELLTGRPPFRAPTPLDTVLQVVNDDPVPPRRLQPRLPRDLETICLKCLQKDPRKRYASAAALANDVDHFLADRPILARPVGRGERAWRWCRRNPVVAGLAAVLAIGGLVAVYFLNAERTETFNNLHRALTAESSLKDQLQKTKDAEQEKTDKLWQSYFDRARAGAFSRQPGQRLDGLDALAAAARIRPADQLRDQAIACMALVDLHTVSSGVALPDGATCLTIDPGGKLYAYADKEGAVSVRRLSDGSEVAHRDPPGMPVAWLIFSPDGRWLADDVDPVLFIWEVETGATPITIPHRLSGFEFSPDSRQAAIGWQGTVYLIDIASGRDRLAVPTGLDYTRLAFSPDGRRLAADRPWGSPVVRIFDAETGGLIQELVLPQTNASAAPDWNATGELLAVGAVNNRAYIFRVSDRRILAVLEGHAQDVTEVHFTHDDAYLLTASWDGSTRLWDVASGRQLLVRVGASSSIDTRRGAPYVGYFADRNNSVQFLEMAGGREYRTLASGLGASQGTYRAVAFSPDGRLLAAGMDEGVRLWDVASGREVAHLPPVQCNSLAFTSDGRALLTCSPAVGFQRWPIDADPSAADGLVIGRPRTLNLPVAPSSFQLTADESVAAVAGQQPRSVVLIDMASEQVRPFLLDHPAVSFVAVSPDGRWVASSGWHAKTQRIWDAHTGRMEKELSLGETTGASFSPDSRCLITTRPEEYCFWDMETWQPGLRIPQEHEPYPGHVAFTRDGALMAVELSPGVFGILDWKTNRILARLEDPTHDRAAFLSFSPDGAQLATVAGYDKAVHLWDLRRIRDHLAEMHLEGAWPPYRPAPPPAPPPRIRLENGIVAGAPVLAPPPAVVVPPLNPIHRAATPQQIQDWVRQLGGDDPRATDDAAAALADVGPAALEALRMAASGPDDASVRRAAEVIDQIEVAEALAPTRVHLKLQNATVADAAAALSKQGGARVESTASPQPGDPPKEITLDLDNVPFWEAIDRLCAAGGLTYLIQVVPPYGAHVQLSDGPRPGKQTIADAGPFRLHAMSWVSSRIMMLNGKGPTATDRLSLNLGLLGSDDAVVGVGPIALQEAEDDAGQSRLPDPAPPVLKQQEFADPTTPVFTPFRQLPLKQSDRRGGVLKRLKGVLPVEVMTERRDLVTATDIGKAQGKTFTRDGVQLHIQSVQGSSNGPGLQQAMVILSLNGQRNWAYDAASQRFELIDAEGRRFRLTWAKLSASARVRPEPAELAMFAAAPGAGFPGALPWAALAINDSRPAHTWTGSLQFPTTDKIDLSTAKLIFYQHRRVRTDLPFEFHDLPLP
jgi:WD40 repeat protein